MKSNHSVTQLLLKLDLLLGTLFVLAMLVHLTGVTAHEWVSLVFLIPMLVHLLFHWDWVVRLPGRAVQRQAGRWRINAVLDLVLYALMCFATVSGLLASRVALPAVGIVIIEDPFWSAVHHQYSNLLFPLVGVHLALHWPWLRRAFSALRIDDRKSPSSPLDNTNGTAP